MRAATAPLRRGAALLPRADEADSPCQGEMSQRDKRGRDHRPLRRGGNLGQRAGLGPAPTALVGLNPGPYGVKSPGKAGGHGERAAGQAPDGHVGPFQNSFSGGRRRETKFPATFFAKLSFKKAGGGHAPPWLLPPAGSRPGGRGLWPSHRWEWARRPEPAPPATGFHSWR